MKKFDSYFISAALGLLSLYAVWHFNIYIDRKSIVLPPPPPAPRTVIRDLPSSMWFEGAPITAETFVRRPAFRPELPKLNSAAQFLLDAIDGRWSGGGIVAVIDAKRVVGYVGVSADELLKPMVVRDISGPMSVIDIGDHRFVFLRRPDGLAISGGSLRLPIELQHE